MAIVDSYSESNENSGRYIGASMIAQGIAQSFTGDGGTLASAQFWIKTYDDSTSGNAVAKIYAHSGTFGTSSVPTGAALATSNNFDVSAVGLSYALHTLTFSGGNKITLTNGTKYVVSLEYSGGDAAKYLVVAYDTSSPGHGGNTVWLESGTWTASSSSDTCFYVNADDTFSPSSSLSPSSSNSPSASVSLSRSPSASASPSSSLSKSPSPSPAIPFFGLRIAKPGFNVLTDYDANKLIFSSDYGTLKYFYKGTMSLTVLSNSTDLGTEASGYYEHNLGYYPFVEVYMKTPTGFYVPIPTTLAGASTSFGGTFNITTTRLNITASNSGYPSFSGNQTYVFIYFIFKNDLNL